MKTYFRMLAVFAAMFIVVGAVQAGDTIEDMEKDIIAKNKNIKSLMADLTITSKMPQMEIEGFGKFEMLRKDDKELSRMEQEITNRMKMGTEWVDMKQTMMSITDGEFTYTLTEHMGQKHAAKTKADPKQQMTGGKAMFDTLREEGNLKRLPDEKLGEQVCYVLEVTPKKPNVQVSKQLLYFRQDLGVPMKTVMYNAEGKPAMTAMFKNVKINEKIDPARFVFKAPEGVQVMDMTKTSMPPGAGK